MTKIVTLDKNSRLNYSCMSQFEEEIKGLCKSVYTSCIHNCQKLETPKWALYVATAELIFFSNIEVIHAQVIHVIHSSALFNYQSNEVDCGTLLL